MLTHCGIPLKVGLSQLQRCYGGHPAASYILLDGGDVSAGDFYGQQGWVEVTVHKPTSGQIKGRFEVTLRSSQGEIVRFTKGAFDATLATEP